MPVLSLCVFYQHAVQYQFANFFENFFYGDLSIVISLQLSYLNSENEWNAAGGLLSVQPAGDCTIRGAVYLWANP